MEDKKILRQKMREMRSSMTLEDMDTRSKQITEQLLQSVIYQECKHICVYEAFRNEVSCKYITKQAFQDGKCVYLPVTEIETRTMEFVRITEHTRYREGAYGIKEPVLNCDVIPLKDSALILMPGLAFDRNKHRLGYGGGYYDKYLSLHKEHITAALCYNFQVVEELRCEEHDVLPDYIVTEKEMF